MLFLTHSFKPEKNFSLLHRASGCVLWELSAHFIRLSPGAAVLHHAVRRDIEIGHIDSPRKETVNVVAYKAAGIKVRVLLQKLSQLGVDIICSFFWPNHAFCIADHIDQIDDRILQDMTELPNSKALVRKDYQKLI